MKRRIHEVSQSINQALTGTYYCGPNTVTTRLTRDGTLDSACQRHDAEAPPGTYGDPLSDARFVKRLRYATTEGYRQKFAKYVADKYFTFKNRNSESFEKEMAYGDNVLQRYVGKVHKRYKDVRSGKKRPWYRKKKITVKASYKKKVYRRRGKFRKGFKPKKGSRPRGRKAMVSRAFVRAFDRVKQNMLPSIRQYDTGYGIFPCGNNLQTYYMPLEWCAYREAEISRIRQLANHNVTDYYSAHVSSWNLSADFTNVSNHKVEVTVYQIRSKKIKKSLAADEDAFNPFLVAWDMDAADEPASLGSYTLADQLTNFDMDGKMAASTIDTTYFAGTGYRIDTVLELNHSSRMKQLYSTKVVKRVVLGPDDTANYTGRVEGRRIHNPKDEGYALTIGQFFRAPVWHCVRVRTFPHVKHEAAVEPEYVVGNPAAYSAMQLL